MTNSCVYFPLLFLLFILLLYRMPPISRVQKNKQALPGVMRISPEGSLAAWQVPIPLHRTQYPCFFFKKAWRQPISVRRHVQLPSAVQFLGSFPHLYWLTILNSQNNFYRSVRSHSEPIYRRRPCSFYIHHDRQCHLADRVSKPWVHITREYGTASLCYC
jgi:hypothetical protein